ncbi:hypothetical protein [Streptomyces sp. ST2-7A]|uniref:hypothetical protein n=1 Tax=Streptomyces sp. ST2-7A TaxID=2907214 RepID=UPI001F215131|nr:hypothetical protein [Streptomyces sp. ST2-7A]MCE7082182.1 hypothetical protein [Streptomyces sp. ST2-7A]
MKDAGDGSEALYESVISVDARRSGSYGDADKPRMRADVHGIVGTAFAHAGVGREDLHLEDRGDGVLVSVSGGIPVTRLLGLWVVEAHEALRETNRALRVPLGLRVGMHVGPVRHDPHGISGRAVDLACRLADSQLSRRLLDAEGADMVVVVSSSLYEDVVAGGGKFIEPARYSPARQDFKEGATRAWFHLPGRPTPALPAEGEEPGPGGPAPDPDADTGGGTGGTDPAPRPASARVPDTAPGVTQTVTAARDVYLAGGDLSRHDGNTYHQPVHIGRVVREPGDGGNR